MDSEPAAPRNAFARLDRVRDWGWVVTAGLGLYCVSFFAWAVWGDPWGGSPEGIADAAFLPAGLAAGLLAWRSSRSNRASREARRAWGWLTLAFFLYWAGDFLWWFYSLDLRPRGAPSIPFSLATLFYVSQYVAFLAGLLALPSGPRKGSRRLEFWLDAAAVLLGGGMVVWHFVIGPAAAQSSGSHASPLLYLFYPVADLVLLLAAAITIPSHKGAARRSLLWLGAGLAFVFVADMIQGANSLGPGPAASGLANGAFMMQWFCWGMAAHTFYGAPVAEASVSVEAPRSLNVLPYVAVSVGYGVLLLAVVVNWSTEFGGLVAWAIALTGVVVARQAVSERENLRLQEERAARKSEARFRALVQNASDMIVVVDTGHRMAYLTPSIERLLGHRADDLLGRDVATLVHPDDIDRVSRQLSEAAERPWAVGPAEWRVRDSGGAWRDVEAVALNLLGDPDIAGIVLTMRDVSERRRAEESLRRARTMEAMGSLVAGVAHEVRNPLFNISATVDMLDVKLGDRPEFAEFAGVLRSQVERLTRLMNDLLDYGRPSILHRVPTSLAHVLGRASSACGSLASGRRVTVEQSVAGDIPLLAIDDARMEQAFQNLLANAIQHAPTGSAVKIVALLDRGRHSVVCSVEDDGPGLPADGAELIFEPFFTQREGGTGLGLSIVRRVVEAHGGIIRAETHEGGGARFTVWLPVGAGPEGGAAPRAETGRLAGRLSGPRG